MLLPLEVVAVGCFAIDSVVEAALVVRIVSSRDRDVSSVGVVLKAES